MSETPKDPETPEYPIISIERELRERDSMRRKAVDIAWQQVDDAKSETDRLAALSNVARMLDVVDEFHRIFPETFPNENEQ